MDVVAFASQGGALRLVSVSKRVAGLFSIRVVLSATRATLLLGWEKDLATFASKETLLLPRRYF